MSQDLYSKSLVELAKDAAHFCRPQAWTHRASVSSALCGDELELFLTLEAGRCTKVGFEAEACILCKASAVVMSRALEDSPLDELREVRESLEEAITQGGSSGSYAGFGVLAKFPSRQSCALLPWRALERAQLGEDQRKQPQRSTASASVEGSEGRRLLPRESSALPRTAFEAIQAWHRQGKAAALATLVAVDGSSPSPLGSQMAISQDGEFWGSVSGGCVESAIVVAGMTLLASQGEQSHERLHYTIANSQAGEVGLPCGGQIQVYLTYAPPLAHIGACQAAKQGRALHFRIFGLDGSPGILCSFDELSDGLPEGLPGGLPEGLGEHLHSEMEAPMLWSDASGREYFVEPLRRPPPLLIVGGTHVAQALSLLAQQLGFAPLIIEPRASLAQPVRFPGAQVLQAQPREVLATRLAKDCAVVMLTHNPRLDDPALELALPSEAYYVGALGSRKTQRARLERLGARGMAPELLQKIYGPVGLAIGAKGAGEIALSILSQIVQVRRNAGQRRAAIGAVVLAAGRSSRFGPDNKLLAPHEDTVVVVSVVRRILAAGIGPCIVVLGHDAAKVRAVLQDYPVRFVENPDCAQGMGTSVACGVRAMAKEAVEAAFVVLGDMPRVRIEDYEALAAAHRASTQHLIVAPEAGQADNRRLGNPILWPRRYFQALGELTGDRGAKALLLDAPGAVLRLYIDHPGVLMDIDRPEDLQAR